MGINDGFPIVGACLPLSGTMGIIDDFDCWELIHLWTMGIIDGFPIVGSLFPPSGQWHNDGFRLFGLIPPSGMGKLMDSIVGAVTAPEHALLMDFRLWELVALLGQWHN